MSSTPSDAPDLTTPVRVIKTAEPSGAWRRWVFAVGLLIVLIAAISVVSRSAEETERAKPVLAEAGAGRPSDDPSQPPRSLDELTTLPRAMRPVATGPTASSELAEVDLPSNDPNDLASYFKPGDPVPDTAELIQALNEAGIHEGIAAFNPPGTSPPMAGLRVPEDFALPPGYVRHHQVTDEGVPIDPILMFAPDVEFYDENGQPIPLPENRVVPPELAPPGMPLEPVSIPDP